MTKWLAMLAYAFSFAAIAAPPVALDSPNTEDSSLSRWTVDINLASLHIGYGMDLNQFNPGIGTSYRWTEDLTLVAGYYKNSYSKPTVYAGAAWLPWKFFSQRLQFGLVGLLATGYEDEGGDVVTPILGGAASLNLTKKDALRAFYYPEGLAKGVFGLQYARTLP